MQVPAVLEDSSLIPRADDAELALIGSAILSRDALEEVVGLVQPSDFWDERCAVLFRAIRALWESGKPIDPISLYDRLRRDGEVDAAGGPKFIADAFHAPHSHSHAVFYAGRVASASMLREAINVGTDIVRDATDNRGEPEAVIARAESKLAGLLDRTIRKSAESIADVLAKTLAEVEARHAPGYEPASVSTSVKTVDEILAGGFRKKQLVILAARPGVGKSALAMQCAWTAAAAGKPSLFISLEMGSLELTERLLCQEALIDGHALRDGRATVDELRRLQACSSEMSGKPLSIIDRGNLAFRELSAIARRMQRKEGLGLIVVDYLQLMQPQNSRVPREQQVAEMSRSLKLLAKDLDVPILCLCQMNRDVEKQGREPRLSDLRESGAIEQDADVVLFLHEADPHATSSDGSSDIKVIVAKQRSGPRGSVAVTWHRKYCKFSEKAAERFREFDSFNADPFAGEV